jgi:putative acetyltransferase
MDVTIRHAEDRDTAAVKQILTDEIVMLGTARLPFVPDTRIAARIAPHPGAFKLVAERDGEVVGIGIMTTHPDVPRHNHAGDIELVAIRSDHQGTGVARALMASLIELADKWLQLKRLGLLVWTDNSRAIRLYETFGFEPEGTIRAYARRPGGYADALMMGRIADRIP